MKKKLIVIILGILIIGATTQVIGVSLRYKFSLEDQQLKTNLKEFFDVGVGIPSNIKYGQNRDLGEDSLFVTVKNYGDLSASVNLDFLLERYDGNDWAEVDSGENGPYDLNPDHWIESFFDVVYEDEGTYRATFSLDTPGFKSFPHWIDDFPDNDVFQIGYWIRDSPTRWYVDPESSQGEMDQKSILFKQ